MKALQNEAYLFLIPISLGPYHRFPDLPRLLGHTVGTSIMHK